MKLPTIKDLVGADKKVYFAFYREGELWYRAENGWEFPIPQDDLRGAIFKPEDKSVLFMRFMRKHLDYCKKMMENEGVDVT